VITLDQYKDLGEEIILVRGVRCAADLLDEMKVMELNHELFGINRFEIIWSKDNCSSTRARKLIEEGRFCEALELIPEESLKMYQGAKDLMAEVQKVFDT
jgi:phosphopantetheine adenylyltransferase